MIQLLPQRHAACGPLDHHNAPSSASDAWRGDRVGGRTLPPRSRQGRIARRLRAAFPCPSNTIKRDCSIYRYTPKGAVESSIVFHFLGTRSVMRILVIADIHA